MMIVFFFKQKTAYEIKECDWSSDVCSSDLYGEDSKEIYKFEKEELGMHKKRKPSRLEGTFAILGLIGGIFFLSGITGNVVGNSTINNSIGAGLFVLGLIGAVVYFKKK